MKYKHYNFCLLLFISFIFFILFISNTNEEFSRIKFLNKNETVNFFKQDKDNYIKNLSKYDILAQKSKSKEEYKNKIIQSADSFTQEEMNKIGVACKKADNALKRIHIPGFNGTKASNLNWNIALTRGRQYEDGLPHTRLDTIFITDRLFNQTDEQLAKTMLHEKVHVYERLFPEDIQIWMNTQGYKRFKKWDDFKIARSNPDIDEWSYLSPDGKPMVVLYKNLQPKSIHEVEYPEYEDSSSEHPYEMLAYTLEEYL